MVFKRLYSWLINLNLFNEEDNLSLLHDQLFATRLFLSLLFLSSFILILFTCLTLQTNNTIIQYPSISQFEYFHKHYESTLICRCSQSNINYNQIISFSPQFHEICSSEFVTQQFISSLFTINMSRYAALDFRLMAMSQFQVLTFLCQISFATITDILNQFSSKQFYSSRTLSRQGFQAEMEAIVEQLKSKTLTDVQHNDRVVSTILTQNRFMSALNTNSYIFLSRYKGIGIYRIGRYPTIESNSDPMSTLR